MLLTVDAGNTNVTLGLYRGDELGPCWRLASDADRMADEYGLQLTGLLAHAGISPQELTGACMASVVPPLTGKLFAACRKYLAVEPLVVGAGVKTGVRVLYEDPRTVGSDRIVNACAVKKLYGGPACVVDFGTATTFDAISPGGEYLGGAIAPGIHIGAHGLYRSTAKLPRVDIERPPSVIGRNTPHAIQSGLVFGYASLVEGMVARFRRELGADMKVVATGGLAELMAGETTVIDVIAPWLTLEGLRLIWDMNLETRR
ncbi:MAG: type III pantothenate kinase [Armatimonadetes bacterium]|nr:type III pantothenate kinase [Armatimonadota bacterium]